MYSAFSIVTKEVCALETVSFGEKLQYMKTMYQVSDKEIGDFVGFVPSLVCRWRKGERTLDEYYDAPTIKRLAVFFIGRSVLKRAQPQLAEILSLAEADIEADNEICINALIKYMFDGHPIGDLVAKKIPSAAVQETSSNFIGVQGVLDALSSLEKRLVNCPGAEISVYLSLEYSSLLQDEAAPGIWEVLYRMNRDEPVRVVFDGWMENAEHVTENLKAQLPFMQTGRIMLHLIKSTQKFFYYNLTFFAKGLGMVITTEPAGGMGVNISLLTESPDYISGMGAVFADFDRISKSLTRHIGGKKDEAVYYGRLFDPTEDLQIISDGISLLYMDEASYLSLLKLNGVKGSQRGYRHKRFIEDKQRFEYFLAEHRIKEIISLPGLDRMISESIIQTPEFTFHDGEIKADKGIMRGLIEGLMEYIEQYENLSVCLERSDELQKGFACEIKGDSFILLHSQYPGGSNMIYSDNWMLIYEYIKQFQEALQSEQLMNTKTAVKTALQLRRERLRSI